MMQLMLDRDLTSSPRVRMAALLLVVSVVLLLAAAVRALRIDPLPVSASSTAVRGSTAASLQRGVQIDPEAVVQQDIFAVDRVAPAERYPMPGEERNRPAAAIVTTPATRPIILGTAVGLDGAFATAQLPNGQPRIVRIGDKLGEFTVIAITRGTVTFRAADEAPFQVNAP